MLCQASARSVPPISRPSPHGLNYDSKGLTRFNPGDSLLNRVPIASNRPQTALNSLPKTALGFWFLWPIASC